MTKSIASLATDMIIALCDDHDALRALDDYDRYLIIRDFRDDFASSNDDQLADARLDDALIDAIMRELSRRIDSTPRTDFDY